MKYRCEVPTCNERAVEVLAVLGAGPVQAVSMCADHAEEWETPVEPAPRRSEVNEVTFDGGGDNPRGDRQGEAGGDE